MSKPSRVPMRPAVGLRTAVLAGLALGLAGPAAAQTTLTFQGSALPPVPLEANSTVSIDANGNLTARCQMDEDDVCLGLAGAGGDKAATSLTRTDNNTEVNPGENITLNWGATAAEVCVATTSPALAAWSGTKSINGGNSTFSLPAVGTYNFGIQCYNVDGSDGAANVSVNVVQGQTPPPPTDGCDITSSDPLFQPAGFTPHIVPWSDAFYGATFPNKPGYASPIGSTTINNADMNGRYISIPFVPAAGTSYSFTWVEAQPVTQLNYRTGRPAHLVYFTISPCAGDFRLESGTSAPANIADEDYARKACRKMSQSSSLYFNSTAPGFNSCGVQAGKTYYINMLFADPRDGLNTSENTCNSGSKCETNVQ